MSWALLISLLWKVGPFIAAAIGFFGYGKYKEHVGAKKVRDELAAADRRVRDEADDIQNDVRAMSPEQVDAELRKRAKR
jgi:hypothetical protein